MAAERRQHRRNETELLDFVEIEEVVVQKVTAQSHGLDDERRDDGGCGSKQRSSAEIANRHAAGVAAARLVADVERESGFDHEIGVRAQVVVAAGEIRQVL